MALLLMWRTSAAQPSKSDFAVKSCFHQNQFDTCSVAALYVAYVWIRIITSMHVWEAAEGLFHFQLFN